MINIPFRFNSYHYYYLLFGFNAFEIICYLAGVFVDFDWSTSSISISIDDDITIIDIIIIDTIIIDTIIIDTIIIDIDTIIDTIVVDIDTIINAIIIDIIIACANSYINIILGIGSIDDSYIILVYSYCYDIDRLLVNMHTP